MFRISRVILFVFFLFFFCFILAPGLDLGVKSVPGHSFPWPWSGGQVKVRVFPRPFYITLPPIPSVNQENTHPPPPPYRQSDGGILSIEALSFQMPHAV